MWIGRPVPSSPDISPETEPYWAAASRGELWFRRCTHCRRAHHYPRANCPLCFSGDLTWEQASGRGTIYSYSVMHQASTPYVVAYVTLEEGPAMMTNLVEVESDTLAIGQPVTVVFEHTADGRGVPMFTPAP